MILDKQVQCTDYIYFFPFTKGCFWSQSCGLSRPRGRYLSLSCLAGIRHGAAVCITAWTMDPVAEMEMAIHELAHVGVDAGGGLVDT
jgi:hypothetical protein